MSVALAVLAVLLLITAFLLVMLTIRNRRLQIELKDLTSRARDRERGAVAKSRVGHVAKITEQLAPLLPGFPDFNVKDVQWIGGVVDMVVWDGLEEGRDVTVILLDVKTGRASANARQRKIRDAVEGHRVKFQVVSIMPVQTVALAEAISLPSAGELGAELIEAGDENSDWEDDVGDSVVFADDPPGT